LTSKGEKSAKYDPKELNLFLNAIWIPRNAEFDVDLEKLEKLEKFQMKKLF
jgi:hypothetical protein